MLPKLVFGNSPTDRILAFIEALKAQGFAGEMSMSDSTRLVMSTDNSVYQVLPEAVLFPKNFHDLQTIFKISHIRQQKISFTLRGGGTSTDGQCLGEGITVDCSKYMNHIKEVNFVEEWVIVEPGVVLDQLNCYLRPHGYFFPVTISPSTRCTLGGMLGTNACGQGSAFYGRMLDHTLEIKSVLIDGSVLTSKKISRAELAELKVQPGPIGQIYRQVDETVTTHKNEIAQFYPELLRLVTGYTLSEVYDAKNKNFNLNAILVGSEGTLATTAEIKLNIIKIPTYKMLVVIQYSQFLTALEDGFLLLETKPQCIETIDEKIIKLARTDILYPKIKNYLENAHPIRGLNMVQFVGDSLEEIQKQIEKLQHILIKQRNIERLHYEIITDEACIHLLWELRKKSAGLLTKDAEHRKPVPGVEDTIVAPKQLAAYIREFRNLLDAEGLDYAMFGHIDVGCLHVRPALDLSDPDDEALFYKISDAVANLVQQYGGVMWGEHGKGFRSQYVPEVYGEVLFKELCKIKKVFDSNNILNPGKIATPNGNRLELTKVSAPRIRGYYDRQINPEQKAEFSSAMSCNGNGSCFNYSNFDMICPSYKVTRDRVQSPKGRASLIREWIRLLSHARDETLKKKIHPEQEKQDFSHEVYKALHGCLGCGACRTQCPVHVNVPSFKAKFLSQYHTRYQRSWRDKLIAHAEELTAWQAKMPRLANALTQNFISLWIAKKILHLTSLPYLSSPPLAELTKKNKMVLVDVDKVYQHEKAVVLLQDWVTSFYEAELVIYFYQFLQMLGFSVQLVKWFENGKAYHVKGYLHEFNDIVLKNTHELDKIKQKEIPIVGIDPSITLTYRNEYREFAAPVKVWLIQEWLAQQNISRRKLTAPDKKLILFMHCTEKTEDITLKNQWVELFEKFGLNLLVVDTGCCGMAGTYGHETEHQVYSKALFKMSWEQYIHPENILLASGFSCRAQMRRMISQRVYHPIEFLLSLDFQ